eukprot:754862-Hanusia_phi.AAC.2
MSKLTSRPVEQGSLLIGNPAGRASNLFRIETKRKHSRELREAGIGVLTTKLTNLRRQSNSELRVQVLETERKMLAKTMILNQMLKDDAALRRTIKKMQLKICHRLRLFKLYDETSKVCSFILESAKSKTKEYFQNSHEITKLQILKQAMDHLDKKQLESDIQGLEDYEHEVKIENEAMRQALKTRFARTLADISCEMNEAAERHARATQGNIVVFSKSSNNRAALIFQNFQPWNGCCQTLTWPFQMWRENKGDCGKNYARNEEHNHSRSICLEGF